jgi:hypothetical protein
MVSKQRTEGFIIKGIKKTNNIILKLTSLTLLASLAGWLLDYGSGLFNYATQKSDFQGNPSNNE